MITIVDITGSPATEEACAGSTLTTPGKRLGDQVDAYAKRYRSLCTTSGSSPPVRNRCVGRNARLSSIQVDLHSVFADL